MCGNILCDCTLNGIPLHGQVQFVNNLADSLNTAASDALYAETLYIMLALPGALIGLGLAYIAALGPEPYLRRVWRHRDHAPCFSG